MKISNSKKELARIISENGGWRDAEFAAQDSNGSVTMFSDKPYRQVIMLESSNAELEGFIVKQKIANWHQTVLSRAEYFHLYPAPDADGWIEWNGGECPLARGSVVDIRHRNGREYIACAALGPWNQTWGRIGENHDDIIAYRLHKQQPKPEFCESVMRSIPESSDKPTFEQLTADYRNAKDYAERKQQEADDAKADAEEKLKALELAGEALGLLVSPITAKQEAEMVIEFKVGDEVECVESNIRRDKYNGMVGRLLLIDEDETSTPYLVDFGGGAKIWCHEVKFIRRP